MTRHTRPLHAICGGPRGVDQHEPGGTDSALTTVVVNTVDNRPMELKLGVAHGARIGAPVA